MLKIKSSTGLNGNRGEIEAISKLGFSVEISRPKSTGREREAEDQLARLLTGSSKGG